MGKDLCYSSWEAQHNKTLSTLSEKKVVLSFSGGKDSSVLLHFFKKASKKYCFKFVVHGVAFPHHVFTPEEKNRLDNYWNDRQVEINWHDAGKTDDAGLNHLVKNNKSPCELCSRTKKEALLSHFKQTGTAWKDMVFVIGYSLWDLVSATVEHTLRTKYGSLETGSFQGKSPEDRFMEISQRFYPIVTLTNGLTIFKPLITYNDEDIRGVISRNNILLTKKSCDYKKYRPKRLLAQYYETFGLNFEFEKVFGFTEKALDLTRIDYYENLELETYVGKMI